MLTMHACMHLSGMLGYLLLGFQHCGRLRFWCGVEERMSRGNAQCSWHING